MDSPITCTKTRSKSVDLQSDDFLKNTFQKYTAYICALSMLRDTMQLELKTKKTIENPKNN